MAFQCAKSHFDVEKRIGTLEASVEMAGVPTVVDLYPLPPSMSSV